MAKNVDICIIGGAGSGLTAAVRAMESGAKSVLVIDKSKIMGGCTRVAQGVFSVESPVQHRLGIHYSADDCFRYHMDMSNWDCDGKLVHDWMRTTGQTIGWLEEKGVHFTKVPTFSGGKQFYHMTDMSTGNDIVKTLLNACKDKGVELLNNARAHSLVTDRNGDVVGVLASLDDTELEIRAKSVIIATGSISNNPELRERFYPGVDFSNIKIMAAVPHNTGDGLIMAEKIGAASTYISTLFIGPHNHPHNPRTGLISRRPYVVKVNRDGERFADEGMPLTKDWGWMFSVALDRQPGRVCYGIMDDAMLRDAIANKRNFTTFEDMQGSIRNNNIAADYGREEAAATFREDRTAWLETIEDDIRSEEKAGRVKICNSLEEIAAWIGAAPETLRATITEYNTFCQNKYDADFLKDPEYLIPVASAPFYVFEAHQGIDTCIGGIRINHRLQVLNKELRPINGLYCVGVAAGSWLAHNYGFFGSEMSFTIYSGYAAGKIAAEYVNNQT